MTYALKDTPCGEVVGKTVCCYPAHVVQSFPNDAALQQLRAESYVGITLFSHTGQPIGLIAVIGRRPLTNRAQAEATLARVAPRAAGELERLAAEANLQKSEERYRLITENASDLIWLYDLKTARFDYISPSAERLLGYTREELQAADLTTVLTPAAAAVARATLERRIAALARGDLSELRHLARYDHVRKDGSIMVGEVTSTALLDQAGQPVKILGVARDISERERHRVALEESENRFRMIFEKAGVGVALVTLEGKFADVNERLCRIVGYSREELLATTFQQITYADDLAPDVALVQRTIAGEIPGFEIEKRYVRKDGSRVWAYLTVAIVRSAAGQPLHFISVVEDLTERKQAELALRASEQRFQRFLNQIPGLAYIKDANGRTLFANQGFSDLLGLKLEDMVGKRSTDFFPADFAQKIDAEDQEVLASGKTKELEEKFGDRIWMTRKFPIVAEGAAPLLAGITLDVTERRHAEQALGVREEIFSSIVEQAKDAIALLDVETGRFIEFSRAAHEDLGYTREEFAGFRIRDIQGEHDESQIREHVRQIITQGGHIFESRHRHRDGTLREVRISARPIKLRGRDCLTAVWTDITERKRAEATLVRMQELLECTGALAEIGGWEVDVKTMKLSWTRETFRIAERDSPVEPVLEEGINLFAPAARPAIAAAVQAAIDHGTPYDLELPVITEKGRHRWVRTQGRAERQDGKTVRLFGTFQDITERRQAEAALQQQAEELRARNAALARFNEAAVGRELRMIELKREINELCGKLREEPRYHVQTSQVPAAPEKETPP